tara:strand:+ start:2483 stop:3556 length:1074 start_codon:yes stop_codon:yes gene_type:complete
MKTYIKFLINIFLKSFIKVFLIFFTLIVLLNIFEQIDFFKEIEVSFTLPLFLSLLNAPSVIFEIMPFIFLISSQIFFIYLIENNELQIFKYSGLTNLKIIKILGIFTFFFGILFIIFFYNFSSKLQNMYLEIKNTYTNDNKYLAVITENGIWIKDEIDQQINIINASKVDDKFLINTVIVQFTKNHDYIKTIKSKKIDISSYSWELYDSLVSENNKNEYIQKFKLMSNFDLEKINSLFSNLSSLSMLEIFKLRKNYKTLNYSLTEIDSHLIVLFSYPFYLTIMTILSSIIMFNIGYQKNLFFNVVFGIFVSVIIYYVNNFFSVLGTTEKIPVSMSILLPLVLLVIINSIFIMKLNEK